MPQPALRINPRRPGIIRRTDDDYGRPTIMDSQGNPRATSAIGNVFMFQGRQYDPETGYYWYRTRYFDPRAGRFTSRDTIGIWGDPLNLGNGYTFVGNNPWTLMDPMGLGFWDTAGDIYNGIGVGLYRTGAGIVQGVENLGVSAYNDPFGTFRACTKDQIEGAVRGVYNTVEAGVIQYRAYRNNGDAWYEAALYAPLNAIDYAAPSIADINEGGSTEEIAARFTQTTLTGTMAYVGAKGTAAGLTRRPPKIAPNAKTVANAVEGKIDDVCEWTGKAEGVALDTNAIIAKLEGLPKDAQAVVRAMAGRNPNVSITAVKEFLRGGGDVNALRAFLQETGGSVGKATSPQVIEQLEALGLKAADARVVGSAIEEGIPLLTRDKGILKKVPDVAEGF